MYWGLTQWGLRKNVEVTTYETRHKNRTIHVIRYLLNCDVVWYYDPYFYVLRNPT